MDSTIVLGSGFLTRLKVKWGHSLIRVSGKPSQRVWTIRQSNGWDYVLICFCFNSEKRDTDHNPCEDEGETITQKDECLLFWMFGPLQYVIHNKSNGPMVLDLDWAGCVDKQDCSYWVLWIQLLTNGGEFHYFFWIKNGKDHLNFYSNSIRPDSFTCVVNCVHV